jgi:uncharacterized protein (TIGR02001 family)
MTVFHTQGRREICIGSQSIAPKKGQGQMKKVGLSVIAALAVAASAAPSFAADVAVKGPKAAPPPPPPPYTLDIAVGGVVMSDYLFRGISQSNKAPSGGAYFEPDLTTPIGTFYVGIAALAISWPSGPGYGFTDPSAEVDFYGGWRNSWGPLSLDIGAVDYYYPGETFNGFTNTSDFWEIYGKIGYDLGAGFSIGANVYYTPNLLHYSTTFAALGISNRPQALYYSGVAAYQFPKWGEIGTKISGELGYWDIDDAGFLAAGATANPSYTYWNVGIAFSYKQLTLDLRYHGTDQNAQDCANFLLVTVPNNSNGWCDDRFVASLKFDTSVAVNH